MANVGLFDVFFTAFRLKQLKMVMTRAAVTLLLALVVCCDTINANQVKNVDAVRLLGDQAWYWPT